MAIIRRGQLGTEITTFPTQPLSDNSQKMCPKCKFSSMTRAYMNGKWDQFTEDYESIDIWSCLKCGTKMPVGEN